MGRQTLHWFVLYLSSRTVTAAGWLQGWFGSAESCLLAAIYPSMSSKPQQDNLLVYAAVFSEIRSSAKQKKEKKICRADWQNVMRIQISCPVILCAALGIQPHPGSVIKYSNLRQSICLEANTQPENMFCLNFIRFCSSYILKILHFIRKPWQQSLIMENGLNQVILEQRRRLKYKSSFSVRFSHSCFLCVCVLWGGGSCEQSQIKLKFYPWSTVEIKLWRSIFTKSFKKAHSGFSDTEILQHCWAAMSALHPLNKKWCQGLKKNTFHHHIMSHFSRKPDNTEWEHSVNDSISACSCPPHHHQTFSSLTNKFLGSSSILGGLFHSKY